MSEAIRQDHPVIEYSDRAKATLLRNERARATRLVRIYGSAWRRIQEHAETLRLQWLAESETGKLTNNQVRDLAAYKNLQRQIAEEVGRFAIYAGDEMDQGLQEAVAAAMDDAKKEVQLALPAIAPQTLDQQWRNLPNTAVEQLLGMTETGSPLRNKLDQELGPAIAGRVGDSIVEAAALGQHPRVTAARVRKELGVGLAWALKTVRTAQLWGYRAAKQATWAENPRLYKGWTWHAKLGETRTCPACIAMHGTLHPATELLNDHYNGRCVPIIETPTYAEILGIDPVAGDVPLSETIESGAEWFAKQAAAFQVQVLGPARHRAYLAGEITMDQGPKGIVGVTTDPVYGPMRHERSLKAILGAEAAKTYYGPKEGGPAAPGAAALPAAEQLPELDEPEVAPDLQERIDAAPPSTYDQAVAEMDAIMADLAIPDQDFGDRIETAAEQELIAEIAEIKPLVDQMVAAGDPTGGGMIGYLDSLNQSLEQEQIINAALWREFGITPDEATAADWAIVEKRLRNEAQTLYKTYTQEGIASQVAEMRGAKRGEWMQVGGQSIQVSRGAFSRREAQRIQGRLWKEATEALRVAYEPLLVRATYTPEEIAEADFWQRRRLLEELGNKELRRAAKSGRVSRIDKVSIEARERAIAAIDYDLAVIAEYAARDPLTTPGLDAWDKMQAADRIRDTVLNEE